MTSGIKGSVMSNKDKGGEKYYVSDHTYKRNNILIVPFAIVVKAGEGFYSMPHTTCV